MKILPGDEADGLPQFPLFCDVIVYVLWFCLSVYALCVSSCGFLPPVCGSVYSPLFVLFFCQKPLVCVPSGFLSRVCSFVLLFASILSLLRREGFGAMAGACSRCTVLIAGAGGGAQRWKEELKLVLLSGGVCRSGNERVAGARLVMVRGEVGCLYCVCWGSKLICIPSPEVP
uniref:Uncharacterized protein n=1 Tax=Populus alba TaxID=43335 RepID=A0A4U5NMS5_POPAL|nr:hypothetical protein D5086_0000261030 [Populus alba]